MGVEITVVGGGISGLACAVGSARAGRAVRVLEQRAVLADVGTALGMWPNALRALDYLGLGDKVRQTGVAQTEAAFRRPDGVVLARIRPRDAVVLISRGALTRILLDALPDGVVKTGVEVSDVDPLLADSAVLVGADGVNSAVRKAL